MRRAAALVLAVALLASCTRSGVTTTRGPSTTIGGPSTTATALVNPRRLAMGLPRTLPAFADFELVPLLDDSTPYAGPPAPTSLDGIVLTPWVERALAETPGLAERLAGNGFAVRPSSSTLFQFVYESAVYEQHPVFVTTDVAAHTWHLVFSKVLRETEEGILLPRLEAFLAEAAGAAQAQAGELAGGGLEDAAARAAEFFEAAALLAGVPVGPTGPRAGAEATLAREAAQLTTSPITSFGECAPEVSPAGCVDYTLYRPRGHYTRSPELERYFTAMAMLGQAAFFVTGSAPAGAEPPIEVDSLRLGLLAARALRTDPALAEAWSAIYEPTAFLVGVADDFTPFELAAAADAVAPGWEADPAAVLEDGTVEEIGRALLETRGVKINPEAASVRVMGARLVLDSYLLDQLAWPNVGEGANRRVYVSSLDVAAVLGSAPAEEVQRAAGEFDFARYGEQLAALRELVDEREPAAWAGTVYDAWLSTLQAIWSPKGEAFPGFMRGEAWAAKSLQTGLGSYAELKHDTLLYAKQGFAAEGAGEEPPIPPRHWVEPDPVAFARLGAAARLLAEGFAERGLLDPDTADLLADLVDTVDRFGRLAADELEARPISPEDNAWLEGIGGLFELFWLRSSDIGPDLDFPGPADTQAAVVSDIFRTTSAVLEIGTGRIDDLFVIVPDDAGHFQVAVGGVYAFYELWADPSRRLTDEEWRAMLDGGEVPDRTEALTLPDGRERPPWQAAFLVSG
jgi:hypothetical protein